MNLDDETQSFLLHAGLPAEAAPFLSFGHDPYDLRPIGQIWRLNPEPPSFEGLHALGVDGQGSPICLRARDGRVVLLDHEHDFAEVYVNESPITLSFFVKWFSELRAYGGWRRLFDVETEMRAVDPMALADGAFWHDVLVGEDDPD